MPRSYMSMPLPMIRHEIEVIGSSVLCCYATTRTAHEQTKIKHVADVGIFSLFWVALTGDGAQAAWPKPIAQEGHLGDACSACRSCCGGGLLETNRAHRRHHQQVCVLRELNSFSKGKIAIKHIPMAVVGTLLLNLMHICQ